MRHSRRQPYSNTETVCLYFLPCVLSPVLDLSLFLYVNAQLIYPAKDLRLNVAGIPMTDEGPLRVGADRVCFVDARRKPWEQNQKSVSDVSSGVPAQSKFAFKSGDCRINSGQVGI
jgi:hypothetical protein